MFFHALYHWLEPHAPKEPRWSPRLTSYLASAISARNVKENKSDKKWVMIIIWILSVVHIGFLAKVFSDVCLSQMSCNHLFSWGNVRGRAAEVWFYLVRAVAKYSAQSRYKANRSVVHHLLNPFRQNHFKPVVGKSKFLSVLRPFNKLSGTKPLCWRLVWNISCTI